MPRISSMHAGAGGTAHNVNMNGPNGGGNKLQGLPPIRNMRSGLVKYVNTRARGDNRNVVFCMNQLGGVGRKSNMFATTADGVKKPCQGETANNSTISLKEIPLNFTSIGDKVDKISAPRSSPAKKNPLWKGEYHNGLTSVITKSVYEIYNELVKAIGQLENLSQGKKFVLIPIMMDSGQNGKNALADKGFINVQGSSEEEEHDVRTIIYLWYTPRALRNVPGMAVDANGFACFNPSFVGKVPSSGEEVGLFVSEEVLSEDESSLFMIVIGNSEEPAAISRPLYLVLNNKDFEGYENELEKFITQMTKIMAVPNVINGLTLAEKNAAETLVEYILGRARYIENSVFYNDSLLDVKNQDFYVPLYFNTHVGTPSAKISSLAPQNPSSSVVAINELTENQRVGALYWVAASGGFEEVDGKLAVSHLPKDENVPFLIFGAGQIPFRLA